MERVLEQQNILSKEKYLISNNVYDNFVAVHKSLNLLEPTPQDWNGNTVDDALEYLGIKDKGIRIKTPIDEVKPHLQVVKVKSDGSFYVTNHKLNKKQADKIILEGQVLYDLSSLSGR